MGGHVVMFCNGPLAYSAKQTKEVPLSTAEAESIEGSRATKEGMFVRGLANNNNKQVHGATLTIGDNKAMIDQCFKEGATVRTRYYERTALFLKRAALLLIIKPVLVKTTDMIADILTKPTDKGTFVKMRNIIMNVHSRLGSQIEQSLVALHGASKQLAAQLFKHVSRA